MDRKVRKDIEKRYGKLSKLYAVASGKESCYFCEQCNQVTKTREVDGGMAPIGIECPYCMANAMCVMEDDVAPNIPVTFEWYRPTLDEVLDMAEKGKLFSVNFVLSGGLMRRKC